MKDSSRAAHFQRIDRDVVWHPFSQMAEYDGLVIQSAQGCWLTAVDGQRYLDGASSLWCNVHGHRHPIIDKAVADQLAQVAHVTSLGMSHPTTLQLAERLVAITPKGLEHVFFSSDGASAIEVAMKMAFQFWRQCPNPEPQRDTFLAIDDAYHGDTLGTTSVGGMSRFRDIFAPLLFPVLRGPCPDPYRSSLDPQELVAVSLRGYDSLLQAHGHRIAAIIVEPRVQAAAGIVIHPAGFLRGIAELAKKFNTLLIADEVAVGFGRTGKMFACEHEAVSPDLLCLGKGITGGYLPLSATLASHQIWEAFRGDAHSDRMFCYGHTYAGNPLAAAAAIGSLDVFESEQTMHQLPGKIGHLSQLLKPLALHPNVGSVRQLGMIAAIEFVTDKATRHPFPRVDRVGARVCRELLNQHVWLRPLADVIPIIPPLAINDAELEQLVQAIVASIEKILG